jgi:5-methylcytosine-specific restriction endonuclease McrA
MPTRLCNQPRCANPATTRGRCAEHARSYNRDTHRNRHIYNSKRWKLTRRAVLLDQPICADCDQALAVDVDHIVPLEQGGDPWARSNLAGLCRSCHGSKTRREQGSSHPMKIIDEIHLADRWRCKTCGGLAYSTSVEGTAGDVAIRAVCVNGHTESVAVSTAGQAA